jgi:hypothetical protein
VFLRAFQAVVSGHVAPPSAEALPPALEAYCGLLRELDASLGRDASRERTRCELAGPLAPPPEALDSFGRLDWMCTDNGTPEPKPRAGWFTLFARLPASARGANEAVAQRALRALAPLHAEMGLARTEHVPQVLPPDLLFPDAARNSDVTHVGRAAAGGLLFELVVSERWVPAPCASKPERYGNLLQFTWRS